jgi:3-oxoacyl-[acyl-carrier protein] reductase
VPYRAVRRAGIEAPATQGLVLEHVAFVVAQAEVRRGFGAGMTRAEIIAGMQQATMLDRLPTLAELGNAAAFLASDRAGAMTATLANTTCGAFLDQQACRGGEP